VTRHVLFLGRDLAWVWRDIRAVAAWTGTRKAVADLPGAVAHAAPDDARFVTQDIPRFWAAYDTARTKRELHAALRGRYLARGTPGLREFQHRRPRDFERLPLQVARCRAFYDSVRPATLHLHEDSAWRTATRHAYHALAALLPGARFPDVTLTVGGLGTAGTAGLTGVLISAEFITRAPATDTTPLNPWERENLRTPDELPFLVMHEVTHFLQCRAYAASARPTLLGRAIEEGVAEFLASLTTGHAPRGAHHAYGLQHERAVWRDFTRVMHHHRTGDWLYQGNRARRRPADLGYFVGERIARAYYDTRTDKTRALTDLLDVRDPLALLHASGYAP